MARGGEREGAGRKPLVEGEASERYTLRLSKAQKVKLEELGGAEWLRQRINKAKVKE